EMRVRKTKRRGRLPIVTDEIEIDWKDGKLEFVETQIDADDETPADSDDETPVIGVNERQQKEEENSIQPTDHSLPSDLSAIALAKGEALAKEGLPPVALAKEGPKLPETTDEARQAPEMTDRGQLTIDDGLTNSMEVQHERD
ncbi:hypothetical protein KKH26_03605, partial [Patescibacteria group bacterium]|nr:hypothetical protein [Patescibacteria group bacterium]